MSNHEEIRVSILTRGAYYRGAVQPAETPGAAAKPRLLDYLNILARGRQAGPQRSVPAIRLDTADVTIYRGSSRVAVVVPSVTVTLPSIVLAFDDGGGPIRKDTIPPAASYEVRMAQQKEPVVVLTRTRHRIAGKVRGGLRRLSVRVAEEPFVAFTDVSIEDLSVEGRAPAELPFVALNMDFTESYWAG